MTQIIGGRGVPDAALKRPLALREAKALLPELRGWSLVGGKTLRRELLMKNFTAAVRFIDAVARAAEAEDHHPDLHLTAYRSLVIELSTHSLGGLTMKDFILAEKISRIPREIAPPARRKHGAAAAGGIAP